MFFRNRPTPTEKNTSRHQLTNFEEQWKILEEGINKLFDFVESDLKKPFDYREHSRLYSTVYNLCTQKVDTGKMSGAPTEILYDRYSKVLSNYLTETVVPALKQKQGEALLIESVKRWRNHLLIVKWITKVFAYLDRYYTKHNNRDSLRDVGLKLYQQLVYQNIKKDMATALLDKIHLERCGETIDRNMMKDGVNLFIEMGLNTMTAYENDLESPLLYQTATFYRRESAKWISEDSCPSYMKKAEDRLEQELNRARSYLHSNTEPNLIMKIEAELIAEHQQRLLEMENSGFISLLKDYKIEDLSRMYRLFKRINKLNPMSDMMRTHITEEGMKILKVHQEKDELHYKDFIEELLGLHKRFSDLVNIQFQKDSLFLEAMKDAFTSFVNTDLINKKHPHSRTSTAELLSTYCDSVMKTTDKIGEDKLDDLLEKIVQLFGYISDKDMFQEFYRRALSKRLLMAKTNYDAERSFIAKLKMKCGAAFTTKLEGMIKDKTLSQELQNSFKEYLHNNKIKLACDFSPQVLTTGFWPAFKIDSLVIPSEELKLCIQTFKEFYDKRTQSRLLKWVNSLGTVTMIARFASGDYSLSISTYQACVLLLFNQKEEWTVEEIQKTLNIPFDDIRKNVFSLSYSKTAKILTKSGSVKSVQPSDTLKVNAEFKSKTRNVRIPNIHFKVSSEERADVDRTTREDRKYAIEAAIVRIMKARKTMAHIKLVEEVQRQLMVYFKPEPKIIKRRIEDLITREYLERDDKDASLYKYLA